VGRVADQSLEESFNAFARRVDRQRGSWLSG
jgi:hypothetical protein